MNKYIEHFKTVLKHKKYVYEACRQCGIPIRGIIHDLSKFSPAEFLESAKYFTGNKTPIITAKENKGYSDAWFHHRGRNKHHWEYWYDDIELGGIPKLMPFEDALEMFCDFIGAGKAYQKENFSYLSEYKWWLSKRERVVMHPVVWHFMDELLRSCADTRGYFENLSFKKCFSIYFKYLVEFKRGKLKGRYKSITKEGKINYD